MRKHILQSKSTTKRWPHRVFHRAIIFSGYMQKCIAHYDCFADGLLGHSIVMPREKWHTSVLVRPKDENDPTVTRSVSADSTENTAMDYLRKLQDAAFDPIRTHPRFMAVENALKATAHD